MTIQISRRSLLRSASAAAFVSALEDEVELGLLSGEPAAMEPANKILASFRAM